MITEHVNNGVHLDRRDFQFIGTSGA
jgi:hypothetical protein